MPKNGPKRTPSAAPAKLSSLSHLRCASLAPWLSVLPMLACGSPAPARAPTADAGSAQVVVAPTPAAAPAPAPAAEPAPAPAAEPAAASEPIDSPGFREALAALRPAGTDGALRALASGPDNADAYAEAALAYAATDVPAMTLLWGLSYQAMGGGAADTALAGALAKVLNERILAKPDERHQVTFNVRLAPGQMPMRRELDGSVQAPVAHVFEALFSPSVTGFRPPWTIEQFYDVLSTWVGVVASQGTALDERVEVDHWLVTTAKAGHLEAFCYQLLGPAFPAQLKAYKAANAAELKAYRDFLEASAFHPARAPMPDDLVRIK